MSFNREDYKNVKESFDERRKKAGDELIARTNEVCLKLPEMKKICDSLADTGPKIYAAALEGRENYEQRLANIRYETEELIKLQKKLLLENGYPEDYLDIKYKCPLCRDEGNINGKMCACMKKELIKAGYKSAGIAGLCGKMSFDTFDLSYYSGDDRRNMELVLQKAKEYAESFSGTGSGSMLFFGGTGLGKTHLSVAVAKKVIERGYYCVYTTSDKLFSDLRDERFKNDDKSPSKTLKYSECELLVIDDLGTELNGRDIVPFLYALLNQRINTGASTVISTNLSHNELLASYDERIVSRLFGEFLPYRFTGKDVRMQKLKN